MAGLKESWVCIMIITITMSSCAASGGARRLMEVTRTGGEACRPGGCGALVDEGRAQGLAVVTAKMATIDGRPTAPGHSPGIGNKIAGNTR